jgi:hypothetical protein
MVDIDLMLLLSFRPINWLYDMYSSLFIRYDWIASNEIGT